MAKTASCFYASPDTMHLKTEFIAANRIDSTDVTYRITTRDDSAADLASSIAFAGLINPPILRPGAETYTVVCGFRRVAACRSLGWQQIPSRVTDPNTSSLDCARIAICDNVTQRPLNVVEISRALNLLGEWLDDTALLQAVKELGLPQGREYIRTLKTVAQLAEPLQAFILSETLALPVALEIGRLEDPTAAADIAILINQLKLSLNKQREILTLLKEIAHRECLSLGILLGEKEFSAIRWDDALDRNQKAQAIRSYLKKRRYPVITETETHFKALVESLKLGKQVNLLPPPNFEGTSYCLNLRFQSLAELKSCKRILEELVHNPVLEKLLN